MSDAGGNGIGFGIGIGIVIGVAGGGWRWSRGGGGQGGEGGQRSSAGASVCRMTCHDMSEWMQERGRGLQEEEGYYYYLENCHFCVLTYRTDNVAD